MTSYELAIDQEGEPFTVPQDVVGWRVRRALDGRGRPELLYRNGKPLIVRVNASHADLLAAAGAGKYRLDPVDALGHVVAEVPVACTGPLREIDETRGEPGCSAESSLGVTAARQIASYEDVICQVVSANTRMVEKALGQLGTVMSGVAELLNAAHNAGITSRVPPLQAPPPPPAPPPVETDEDDADDTEESERGAPASGVSEVVQLIIKETVNKVVPLIFEKLTGSNGTGGGGLPLEAFFDWRKAVPNPGTATTVPTAPSAPGAPTTPSPAATAAPASSPASSHATSSVTPAMAGAAPSRESTLGAAPAEMPTSPAASAPQTHEEATAMLNAHFLRVWQGLDPAERAYAGQLMTRLPAEQRTAWLAELARLTVPEAIARARAVIAAQAPPSPATTQLPTPPIQGDPS